MSTSARLSSPILVSADATPPAASESRSHVDHAPESNANVSTTSFPRSSTADRNVNLHNPSPILLTEYPLTPQMPLAAASASNKTVANFGNTERYDNRINGSAPVINGKSNSRFSADNAQTSATPSVTQSASFPGYSRHALSTRPQDPTTVYIGNDDSSSESESTDHGSSYVMNIRDKNKPSHLVQVVVSGPQLLPERYLLQRVREYATHATYVSHNCRPKVYPSSSMTDKRVVQHERHKVQHQQKRPSTTRSARQPDRNLLDRQERSPSVSLEVPVHEIASDTQLPSETSKSKEQRLSYASRKRLGRKELNRIALQYKSPLVRKRRRLMAHRIKRYGHDFRDFKPREKRYVALNPILESSDEDMPERDLPENGVSEDGDDVLEVLTKENLEWLKDWKDNDPEVCCVCYEDTCSSTNQFVYCDTPDCEVIVHQACYAIHECPGSVDDWFCDRCDSLKHNPQKVITCALCPSSRGAFRKLKEPIFGLEWIHVTCALYIPGVLIGDQRNISAISAKKVPVKNWKSKCYLCEDDVKAEYGACIRCTEHGCTNWFHATCGLKYSLSRAHHRGKRTMRCIEHDHREALRTWTPQMRLSNWEKWVDNRDDYLRTFSESVDAKAKCLDAWYEAYSDFGKRPGDIGNVEAFIGYAGRLRNMLQERRAFALKEIALSLAAVKTIKHRLEAENEFESSELILELEDLRDRISSARSLNRVIKYFLDDIRVQTTQLVEMVQTRSKIDKSDSGHTATRTTRSPEPQPVDSAAHENASDVDQLVSSDDEDIRTSQERNKRLPRKRKAARTGVVSSDEGSAYSPAEASEDDTVMHASESEKGTPEPTTRPKGRKGRPKKEKTAAESATVARRAIERSRSETPKAARIPKATMTVAEERKARGEILKCSECGNEELPSSVLERLNISEEYMQDLEKTKHLRPNGYTGRGTYWDPRVFIDCCKCDRVYHCGCIDPPIRNFPSPRELFVCEECDDAEEEDKETASKQKPEIIGERFRSRAPINYRV